MGTGSDINGPDGEGQRVPDHLAHEVKSIGALHGSARGSRNVEQRLQAMRRVGRLDGGRLLDVGCGTGEYTLRMAASFDHTVGIDVEEDRLDLLSQHLPPNVEIGLESATSMSFDDDSFDTVTMIEVLEHLADPPASLREIARVLRPGGELLLTTPNRLWPFEQHGVKVGSRRVSGYAFPGLVWVKPLHRRVSNSDAFTRSDLQKLADGAGLILGGVTHMMPPLDSLRPGHPIHRMTDRIDETMLSTFAQTIVAAMTKPERGGS